MRERRIPAQTQRHERLRFRTSGHASCSLLHGHETYSGMGPSRARPRAMNDEPGMPMARAFLYPPGVRNRAKISSALSRKTQERQRAFRSRRCPHPAALVWCRRPEFVVLRSPQVCESRWDSARPMAAPPPDHGRCAGANALRSRTGTQAI
jgi:hypothetical protein